MLRMRMMFEALTAEASPPSSSALHINSYELPSSSRLPKFMIAAVAGFIVLITAVYYFCKWWFFQKCGESPASQTADDASSSPEATVTIPVIVVTPEDGASKRLGSKIAMSIPAIEYSQLQEVRAEKKEAHIRDLEGESCAICLTEFARSRGALIKILPKCDHAFHSSCIDLWLCTHASCPICRASLFVSLFSNCAPPRPCSSPNSRSPAPEPEEHHSPAREEDPEDHV